MQPCLAFEFTGGAAGFQYYPEWVLADAADRILHSLWSEVAWVQEPIRLFGRKVLQPRLTAWFADEGVSYQYSGLNLQAQTWHPALSGIRNRLQHEMGSPFNSVLANAYRDGRDSMGWHCDDEPELGDEPTIASISFGAARRFLIRPKPDGPSSVINLEHGSLLMMSGRSQVDYRHSVPKTRKPVGLRINLTFRQVVN